MNLGIIFINTISFVFNLASFYKDGSVRSLGFSAMSLGLVVIFSLMFIKE